jgi:hypothetical protein
VVVALRAAKRAAKPRGRHAAHPLGAVFREILLRLRTAFAGHHVEPVVAGRDALLDRRVGQEIAGELLGRELIEALVGVEGVDHVIAIREDALVLIAVKTHRVREARDIEPPHRHALAVVGRSEQALDLFLVGVARAVGEKRRCLRRVGGSPVRSSETRRNSRVFSASGEGLIFLLGEARG